MNRTTTENLEIYINDVLKEELKYLEEHIRVYNSEVEQFVQLKNTLQTINDDLPVPFKTQMNIGSNIFMEAQVKNMDKVLVDVGKNCFLEFSADEAIKFADLKIKVLTKECDVVRAESVKKRALIKVALMHLGEKENLLSNDSQS